MKKTLMFALVALCLTACGGNDEPEEPKPTMTEEVRTLWHSLSGSYSTDFFYNSTSDKVWYTETITFAPYTEPRKLSPTETLAVGDVYAYGTATIEDTRFTAISGKKYCYYSLQGSSYKSPTVTFYEYADDNGNGIGKPDERNIRLLSADKFVMWAYGLTEAENAHTYVRR